MITHFDESYCPLYPDFCQEEYRARQMQLQTAPLPAGWKLSDDGSFAYREFPESAWKVLAVKVDAIELDGTCIAGFFPSYPHIQQKGLCYKKESFYVYSDDCVEMMHWVEQNVEALSKDYDENLSLPDDYSRGFTHRQTAPTPM